MINLLVTGANGFLGTHVKSQLNVIKSNDLNIFTPKSSEMNALDMWELVDFCKTYRIDRILHMAAVCAGIQGNAERPADFLYANTHMALNIYETAKICKISYVHSLGSVCMYPKFCPIPFKEENIWDGAAEETNFPYGQAKRTLMMLGQTYRQQYGIKGSFLIPVNLFGPHDHFNTATAHVVPSLIMKFENAKINNLSHVECWGNGTTTSREFLYAEDCAEAISQTVISNFDYDLPINIGAGKEIKIFDLAHMIAGIVGYSGDIVFNGRLDGQPRRCLDISKAKKLLGWKAKTSLYGGLVKTVEWYRKNK